MKRLYVNMQEEALNMIDSLQPGTVVQLESTEIEEKLKEIYKPYISEAWFDSFIEYYGKELINYSIADEYEAKIEHIVINQSKTIPTNFSFTIYLDYGKSDSMRKNISFSGNAQLSNGDDKISYIHFITSNEFRTEFRNALP